MMNFCTLFDSYYIHKGIAAYLSLERYTDDFHLYVMAFDIDCYNKLKEIGFKNMTVELVDNFETPELLKVKPSRNRAEYCWTCGPSVIDFFMKSYNLENLTYIDADLFFLSSPEVLFKEIGNKDIAITEHNNEDSSISGRFCVQYQYFTNKREGLASLHWWRDRCIEWCFSRYEDGKFGDQRYIEQFPDRYKSLCIIQNRGAGIASWNMNRYDYTNHSVIFEGEEYDFVFFHMHGIRTDIVDSVLQIHCVTCILNDDTKKLFFEPYAKLLMQVYNDYLGKQVKDFVIIERTKLSILYSDIKKIFRGNKLIRKIYFTFKSYNGLEKKQI